MRFRTLAYYLREASRSLVRNRLMSVASILTVASCIFILSVFYCVSANIEYFLGQIESSIQINAFVHEDASMDGVSALYEKILAIPHVVKASYKSAGDAMDEMKEIIDPGMLSGLERDNPFPRSFEIEIDDLRNQEDVAQALLNLEPDGIDIVRYSQDLAEITKTVSDAIRAVCLVLIVILGVISIVIIINTIRITVNARKNEINIMKYVGATDWFIRWPFVIEGVLIGVIGGFLPAVLCWLSYNRVLAMIKEGLPVIGYVQFRPGYDIFAYLFPFDLALGMLIGVIGSVVSVRRHLKV